MKPCPRCRAALTNHAMTCECGWLQEAGGMGVQQADAFEDPIAPEDTSLSHMVEDVKALARNKLLLAAGLLIGATLVAALVFRLAGS
jgi:hypothetical protein